MNSLEFPLRSCFVAVPLDKNASVLFQKLQESLQQFADILSFQNPESPHLTLHYWGTLMEIEYHQILRQLPVIASHTEPFDLLVQGVDTFGKRGSEKVLFLRIPFSEDLARLKKRCPWPSVDPDGLGFTPHITIARIRHPQKFAVYRKDIFKILGSPELHTHCDRIRLYAEVNRKKQTAISEALFGGM